MAAAFDFPRAPRAVLPPPRSRWAWTVWLLIPFGVLAAIGPLVAFVIVAGDPGPIVATETRVDGRPALQLVTCARDLQLTAVRVSTADGDRPLWSATGRTAPPALLFFDALPAGLSPSALWSPDLLAGSVRVSYDLSDSTEPWFVVDDVVDFSRIADGAYVQGGTDVARTDVDHECEDRS